MNAVRPYRSLFDALAAFTRIGDPAPGVPMTERSREDLEREVLELRAELARRDLHAAPEVRERLFGGLLEAAPDGIVITDARGVIRLVNRNAELLLGYEPGELVGMPIEVLVPEGLRRKHVDDRKVYVTEPTARRMGTGMSLVARRKDGTELPVEVSLSPLETPEGRFVVSAVRDVSERREAERMLRHQAAALGRSNAQLEQFAYVASHDLQEPLRMISSYLQLLERRYTTRLDDDGREFIGYAVDGAKRMQGLIADLLTYSRVSSRELVHASVDLGQVLSRVLGDLRLQLEESGATVTGERLPTVSADPTQMAQLFQNLVGNAVKFHQPGEPPRVRVEAERIDGAWRLRVIDHGIGIDPQYAERIFQIFQRLHTRREYPGTGIGLAICKRIVEGHGGEIHLETTEGGGATFVFTIPDWRPA